MNYCLGSRRTRSFMWSKTLFLVIFKKDNQHFKPTTPLLSSNLIVIFEVKTIDMSDNIIQDQHIYLLNITFKYLS